ncbi:MAG: hypothetical protein WBD53_09650 [Xanthobacteraceae bacterium]
MCETLPYRSDDFKLECGIMRVRDTHWRQQAGAQQKMPAANPGLMVVDCRVIAAAQNFAKFGRKVRQVRAFERQIKYLAAKASDFVIEAAALTAGGDEIELWRTLPSRVPIVEELQEPALGPAHAERAQKVKDAHPNLT